MLTLRQHTSGEEVLVPADKLRGAQTQRSLDHFSIDKDWDPGPLPPEAAAT
jgi:hypothetical protein